MTEVSQSFLLTKIVARKAVDLVRPAILSAMESGLLKRKDFHVVIMDPCIRPWEVTDPSLAILHEESFGNRMQWELDFQKIARGKAFLSWRTGIPTHLIRETMPHLLAAGDTIFYGSAVHHGIVVAASGVQPWFDEMFSGWTADACRALCIGEMQEKVLKDGRMFIGELPHQE